MKKATKPQTSPTINKAPTDERTGLERSRTFPTVNVFAQKIKAQKPDMPDTQAEQQKFIDAIERGLRDVSEGRTYTEKEVEILLFKAFGVKSRSRLKR